MYVIEEIESPLPAMKELNDKDKISSEIVQMRAGRQKFSIHEMKNNQRKDGDESVSRENTSGEQKNLQ